MVAIQSLVGGSINGAALDLMQPHCRADDSLLVRYLVSGKREDHQMTPLVASLAKYSAYHRDRRNILTHMVGIPMIVLAVTILLSRPNFWLAGLPLSPAKVAAVAAALFYLRLDARFGIVMTILLALCVSLGGVVAEQPTLAWLSAGGSLFVAGWVLQFLGHFYEGRKPAFVDDVRGLIVGPLFVVAEIAFSLGLRDKVKADVARSAARWSLR